MVHTLKKYKNFRDIKTRKIINIGEISPYFLELYRISINNSQNNSLIFILKYRNNTFMFTGDADLIILNVSKLKEYATSLGIDLKVDMFKYPHHGNQYLDDDFLNATSPLIVIVPIYNSSSYPSSGNSSSIKNYATVY